MGVANVTNHADHSNLIQTHMKIEIAQYIKSIYNNVELDAKNCVKRLLLIMIAYNKYKYIEHINETDMDDADISYILNDYLFLLHKKDNNDKRFEYIDRKLGYCDVSKCNIFRRNNRNKLYQISDGIDDG
eukprot:20306_1